MFRPTSVGTGPTGLEPGQSAELLPTPLVPTSHRARTVHRPPSTTEVRAEVGVPRSGTRRGSTGRRGPAGATADQSVEVTVVDPLSLRRRWRADALGPRSAPGEGGPGWLGGPGSESVPSEPEPSGRRAGLSPPQRNGGTHVTEAPGWDPTSLGEMPEGPPPNLYVMTSPVPPLRNGCQEDYPVRCRDPSVDGVHRVVPRSTLGS